MEKLNNTWKMVIRLGLTVIYLGGCYVAGRMVGEWVANKLD